MEPLLKWMYTGDAAGLAVWIARRGREALKGVVENARWLEVEESRIMEVVGDQQF